MRRPGFGRVFFYACMAAMAIKIGLANALGDAANGKRPVV
jgi:hypothetical protein